VIGVEIARTDSQGREAPVLVHVNKEAVLCAGAIHTPQLLLLSGIGPRKDLEKLGIPVIKADDNVGANLSDVGPIFLFV
jgi:choline dehydrogenase